MPLISVIIPVYNVSKYLRDCIDSLVSQSSDDFELILVDDGSTDGSGEICDEYKTIDDRIVVIHKENGGLVSARIAGAKVAQGEYIANVDGDDWVSKQYISTLTSIIHTYNPDVIHINSYNVLNDKKIACRASIKCGFYDKERIAECLFPILIENEYGKYIDHSIWALISRTSLYRECQLNVIEGISIGEDCACSKPLLYKADSLLFLDECLYYYRHNPDSMTKRRKPYSFNNPLLVVESIEKNMNCDEYQFRSQLSRYVVHNLFVVCMTRFYTKRPYAEAKKEIVAEIGKRYYQKHIENCKYSIWYLKGNLAYLLLKHKLIWMIRICSLFY